jgi:hypothetical protein
MRNKETIEEYVKTYYEENIDQSNIPREHYKWEIQDLMSGFAYKWQQEKMYSEEEVEDLIYNVCGTVARLQGITLNGNNIKAAFEQFKNK